VQRSRTNTPLQALTLMNDPAFVELAGGIAARIVAQRGDRSIEDNVAWAFRFCTGRRPKAVERQHLVRVLSRELARYRENPAEARSVVRGLEGPALKRYDVEDEPRLAAWFHVANVLLNLDETITKG
jgi:hypothetical protein